MIAAIIASTPRNNRLLELYNENLKSLGWTNIADGSLRLLIKTAVKRISETGHLG